MLSAPSMAGELLPFSLPLKINLLEIFFGVSLQLTVEGHQKPWERLKQIGNKELHGAEIVQLFEERAGDSSC